MASPFLPFWHSLPGSPGIRCQARHFIFSQECQVYVARFDWFTLPGLPLARYIPLGIVCQARQVYFARLARYTLPGSPGIHCQALQVNFTRLARYILPGSPGKLCQARQVYVARLAGYILPGSYFSNYLRISVRISSHDGMNFAWLYPIIVCVYRGFRAVVDIVDKYLGFNNFIVLKTQFIFCI